MSKTPGWQKNRFDLKINPTFKNFLPSLAERERDGLAVEIKKAGEATDPVIYWKKTRDIVDGFNRFEICECGEHIYTAHGMDFADENEVCQWIVRHQQSRRNMTPPELEKVSQKLAEMLGGKEKKGPLTGRKGQKHSIARKVSEITGESPLKVRDRLRRAKLADKLAEPIQQAYETGKAKLTTGELAALGKLPQAEQLGIMEGWIEGTHKSLGDSLESYLGTPPRKKKPKQESPEPEESHDPEQVEEEAVEKGRSVLDSSGDFQKALSSAGVLLRSVDSLGKQFYASRGDHYEKLRRGLDTVVLLLEEWMEAENTCGIAAESEDW